MLQMVNTLQIILKNKKKENMINGTKIYLFQSTIYKWH